jgi:hypothetical protein
VLVVPQPSGTAGVQSVTIPNVNAGGLTVIYPSSSSQGVPPNSAAHVDPNATAIGLGIRQVATPPKITPKKGRKSKKKGKVRPRFPRWTNVAGLMSRFSG